MARKKGRRGFYKSASVPLAIFLVLAMVGWIPHDDSPDGAGAITSGSLRAVLIDELSVNDPAPYLRETVTDQLSRIGYEVDYYGPGNATLGFFLNLPSQGYNLVIIRAHSTADAIFTVEPYDTYGFLLEQINDQVAVAELDDRPYFAITAQFVGERMNGMFESSMILMMGCSGLSNPEMAEAFLGKGASAYIGWDGPVTSGHTDATIGALVESLGEGKTLREAVRLVPEKVGPDLLFNSQLRLYDSAEGTRRQLAGYAVQLGLAMAVLSLIILGPLIVLVIPRLLGGQTVLPRLRWVHDGRLRLRPPPR